jgi:hypothetical protein
MSVEIEFKLTSIGKTDIANLLAGETLEVKKVYITDAQSGDNESYVSGLSGNIVFQGDVQGEILYEKDEVLYTKDEWDATMPSGTIPDTGLLHVEFFDDSENYYGGKTIAITYTKELEERILCIATGETASDELVVKHFSPLSLSLDLRFESAENISFENINLSFPPATEGRRGSVKLASSADVMAGTGSGVVTSQNLNTKLGNYVTLDTHPLLQAGSSNIETPVGSIVWLSVQINDGSTPPNDKIGTQIISSNNTACYAGNIGTSGTIQQYTNGYVFVALQSILWETIDNKPTASFLAMRIS